MIIFDCYFRIARGPHLEQSLSHYLLEVNRGKGKSPTNVFLMGNHLNSGKNPLIYS